MADLIIHELKNFQSHALEMERWAGRMIRKLEKKEKQPRKKHGASHAQLEEIASKYRHKFLKKSAKLGASNKSAL